MKRVHKLLDFFLRPLAGLIQEHTKHSLVAQIDNAIFRQTFDSIRNRHVGHAGKLCLFVRATHERQFVVDHVLDEVRHTSIRIFTGTGHELVVRLQQVLQWDCRFAGRIDLIRRHADVDVLIQPHQLLIEVLVLLLEVLVDHLVFVPQGNVALLDRLLSLLVVVLAAQLLVVLVVI
ncbi:hypothetical protein D3C76_1186370 [compost metagenome]